MENWAKRFPSNKSNIRLLAPDWYVALKNANASQKEIYDAVEAFCQQSMPNQRIDMALVQLMIANYEA